MVDDIEHSVNLIDTLQDPGLFDHPIETFEVIETHISWVLLTGAYAYKIKKPVSFGFLDFSTLDLRQYYCEEELRLNRQLAPQIYLDIVTIHGSPEQPNLTGNGPVIEYAVKMKQFPQQAQLDRMLEDKRLLPLHIDKLARTVAEFHSSIEQVPVDNPYGDIQHISEPVLENSTQIKASVTDNTALAYLDAVQQWSETQIGKLHEIFNERKNQGMVRACHGDMHLRNIALIDEEPVIFDRIEFNTNLYFIDVMSEVAFLVMDLEYRQQQELAQRFLNLYLEYTGDYQGLQVLDFYKVYRAMVRAKVDALRLPQEQPGSPEHQHTWHSFMKHLQLARKYITRDRPFMLINSGLSGSGKSYISRQLVEKLPAIAIRSDIERKRLFSKTIDQHADDGINTGIYTPQASDTTYQKLSELAAQILTANHSVIIDAANLKQGQRQIFVNLAKNLSVPCRILLYTASPDTLRSRVSQRMQNEKDASDATPEVLQQQLEHQEPVGPHEKALTITIDTETDIDSSQLIRQIRTSMASATTL